MRRFKYISLLLVMLSTVGCNLLRPSFPKYDNFETNPQRLVGYGFVNKWIHCSKSEWESMADTMVKAGLNITHVELLSFGKDGFYDNPDYAIDKYKEFVKIFRSRRIMIFTTVINWNVGSGLAKNGRISICEGRYNLDWYAHIINRIKNEIGTEAIILCAASEWGPGGRNSQCWKKAEQFHNWTAQNWDGMKVYNKEARPGGAPAGHIIAYHILTAKGLGAKSSNKLIITDTSNILNYLGGLHNFANNHDRLRDLVKGTKQNGMGFILYGFDSPAIDYEAIDVIGKAWAE